MKYACLNVSERSYYWHVSEYYGRHRSLLPENNDKREPSGEYVIRCIDIYLSGTGLHMPTCAGSLCCLAISSSYPFSGMSRPSAIGYDG